MNLLAAKNKAFKLIDSYSRKGSIQDPNSTKQQDYTLKMPDLFDTAQFQVATIKKIVRAKKISHNMPLNGLAMPLYQNDIVRYTGTEQSYILNGANAYDFKVDDVAIVYIKEKINGVWTTLITINSTLVNAGYYTEYKGLIVASSPTNDIGIFFNGPTAYNHRDRALFTDKFSDVTRIPNFQSYVLYTMPTDFYQLSKVVLKGNIANSQLYENTADFYWEQRSIIAINWYNQAEYSVEYFAYPKTIDATTLDTYEFEVDPEAQECMPFFVASQLLVNENTTVSDRLLAIYNNMLANLDTKISDGANGVANSLFSGSSAGNKLF